MLTPHPRRLIEVDLPIREISAHARREKSIRHGHISTLHIWWARRPLAACRAVLCAALWPDPADEHCPQPFREAVAHALTQFAEQVRTDNSLTPLIASHWSRWVRTNATSLRADQPANWGDMRYALLDFIADFANWDASTVPAFLETARTLTQAAHESLGGLPGTRPLVVDPFAGGGAIPLEALRVGADAFASDLNPVAVLLNKVVLEYIPRYGQQLADEVRKWGQWIKEQAEAELAAFYPSVTLPPEAYTPQPDAVRKVAGVDWTLNAIHRETPIAYIWARTITCEGPTCGAEVPLMRSLWLAKKTGRSVALHMRPDPETRHIHFDLIEKTNGKWINRTNPQSTINNPQFDGTVRRGSATCPVCGYTTPVERVRVQLRERRGGAHDARLVAVVTTLETERTAPKREPEIMAEIGRFYRLPTNADLDAIRHAAEELERRKAAHEGALSLVPDEEISLNEIRRISVPLYGMTHWGDLFSDRQSLSLTTLAKKLHILIEKGVSHEVITCLALAIDRQTNATVSLARWNLSGEKVEGVFARQAIGMVWDFAEVYAISDMTGGFPGALEWVAEVIDGNAKINNEQGQVVKASATTHPLPNDIANLYITDPPYYDAVPYAYLSDYFYGWLRRSLANVHVGLLSEAQVPKEEEIVVDRPHELSNSKKNIDFYERELTKAFADGQRLLAHNGIGTIVFASKTTASWEAILQAVVDANWVITGSWPIDTEMGARVAAQGQARLASSIHLVCRPRENADGELTTKIGDWREVLRELPGRIHAWLPRLAQEGVVGADAIFACLGPALEIFSRYSRVEKASGESVSLREYLEHVWAAVSREALTMIFQGADATGFEEDARLTAMWLWTLSATAEDSSASTEEGDDESDDEDTPARSAGKSSGFTLEYDAARKIAQGLGAHLEKLDALVDIKGDKATLIPVRARERFLFGHEGLIPGDPHRREKVSSQMSFLDTLSPDPTDSTTGWEAMESLPPGNTTLDKIHQSMLLFASGRGGALKRFLVDDAVGRDERFWRLAQALSALYPSASDEKRWVDGVLGRKKGLGF